MRAKKVKFQRDNRRMCSRPSFNDVQQFLCIAELDVFINVLLICARYHRNHKKYAIMYLIALQYFVFDISSVSFSNFYSNKIFRRKTRSMHLRCFIFYVPVGHVVSLMTCLYVKLSTTIDPISTLCSLRVWTFLCYLYMVPVSTWRCLQICRRSLRTTKC